MRAATLPGVFPLGVLAHDHQVLQPHPAQSRRVQTRLHRHRVARDQLVLWVETASEVLAECAAATGIGDGTGAGTGESAAGDTASLFTPDRFPELVRATRSRLAEVDPHYRRLEQLPGGLGVMADDLAAGVYARVVMQLWILFQAKGGL